jgi:DNA repair exonuclease SbcCD ATPase subunit
MKVSTIGTELDQTTERLSELITMRDRINTNLQTLQSGFVNGKIPLGEMEVEQARLNTLNSSITALEAKQSELQAAFDELAATEARQNLLESAKAAANEAEKLWSETLELRRELDTKIGELAEKFVDKMLLFRAKQKDYMRLRGQVQPNQTLGISDELVRLLERNHLNFPPVRCGLAVHHAVEAIGVEREKLEKAERQAEKARQMSSGRY